MGATRIAIGPNSSPFAEQAVRTGGGQPVKLGEHADAVVWLSAHDLDGLAALLEEQPEIRWVQLPFAGIENAVAAGLRQGFVCRTGRGARPDPGPGRSAPSA